MPQRTAKGLHATADGRPWTGSHGTAVATIGVCVTPAHEATCRVLHLGSKPPDQIRVAIDLTLGELNHFDEPSSFSQKRSNWKL